MHIKIYTAPEFPVCEELKNFLWANEVMFEEADVSMDAAAWKELLAKSGQMGVPVAEIEGEMVLGFNRPKLEELLKKHSAKS